MTRYIVLLSAVMLAAGCESQGTGTANVAERAAVTYAAKAQYPGRAETSPDLHLVAINSPDQKRLEIYNLTDRQIDAEAVWVNGTYVHKIGQIPPHGHINVPYDVLVQAGTGVRVLAEVGDPIRKVEIQTTDGHLYSVEGPVDR